MKEKQKNVNQKKGISLIVLVITIIVIVILAVAVILSMANNNPISNANKAKFQNDMKSIKEEVELVKASNYAKSQGKSAGPIDFATLSSASKYQDKVFDVLGELYLNSDKLSQEEKEWADELGIKRSSDGFIYAEDNKTIIGYDKTKTKYTDKEYTEGQVEIVFPSGVTIGNVNFDFNRKSTTFPENVSFDVSGGSNIFGSGKFGNLIYLNYDWPNSPVFNAIDESDEFIVPRSRFKSAPFCTEKMKEDILVEMAGLYTDENFKEIEPGYYILVEEEFTSFGIYYTSFFSNTTVKIVDY